MVKLPVENFLLDPSGQTAGPEAGVSGLPLELWAGCWVAVCTGALCSLRAFPVAFALLGFFPPQPRSV